MRKDILDFIVSYLFTLDNDRILGLKYEYMLLYFFPWECLCYYITLLELVVL